MREIPNTVGEHVHEVAERAITVAQDAREPVWFGFNGVRLQVESWDTPEAVVSRYRKAFQETRKDTEHE